MHYLIFYEKIADYEELQKPHATAHRDYFVQRAAQGDMLLGGSLEDPTDGSAVIVFEAESAAVVETFVKEDPYVIHGIVNKWSVRRWDIVVGSRLPGLVG